MKPLNPTFLAFLLIMLVASSCAKEEAGMEQELLGTWKLTEKTIDDAAVALSDCEKLSTLEFQEYNFCILYDGCAGDSINSGWSYTYDMLNISVLLPVAYYVEQISESTLVIKQYDITAEGDLQSTILSYIKNL